MTGILKTFYVLFFSTSRANVDLEYNFIFRMTASQYITEIKSCPALF